MPPLRNQKNRVRWLPVRLCWQGQYLKHSIDRLAKWTNLDIPSEAGYPFKRQGLAITRLWQRQTGNLDGILFLDGDVAIDPIDYRQMEASIARHRNEVSVAPSMLWPWATGLNAPIWAHTRTRDYEIADDKIEHFALVFAYLPSALMNDCVEHGMDTWLHPDVDEKVCERRKALSTKVNLVRGAQPKLLTY